MKKSSYLSERVYDAIPSEINMESLEYWKKILKEEGLQYVKKNHLEYFFGFINNCAFSSHEKSQPRNFVKLSLNKKAFRHEGEKMVFGAFYDPFVQEANRQLREIVIQRRYINESILFDFQQFLFNSLNNLCIRTLIYEMHICGQEGVLRGNESEQYQYYIDHFLKDKQYLNDLFSLYPVLERRINEIIQNAIDIYKEVIERIEKDADVLMKKFNITEKGFVVNHLSTDFSDSHKKGRRVFCVEFVSGDKILYKPRSLQNEIKLQEITNYFYRICNLGSYEYSILDKEMYGWCEIVIQRDCKSIEELSRYYQRIGIILFINYLLEGGDIHFENLIACNEYPVIIDAETFIGNIEENNGKSAAEKVASLLRKSVLYSGILPFYSWNNAGDTGINMSAISGEEGQKFPIKIPFIINPKSVNMRVVYDYPVSKGNHNLAMLKGRFIQPSEFADKIIQGFESAYLGAMENTETLLRIIQQYGELEVRYLIRNTQQYAIVLRYIDTISEGEQNIEDFNTGIFSGEGSILYTLGILYEIYDDIKYKEYFDKWLNCMETLILEDRLFDMISGNSGIVLVLINMYRKTKKPIYLQKAIQIAEQLIENMITENGKVGWKSEVVPEVLAGFAHGNSGFIELFSRLYEVYPQTKYLDILSSLVEYENSLYSEKDNNWIDLRKFSEVDQHKSQPIAWCHGAAGILLSRLTLYNAIKNLGETALLQQAIKDISLAKNKLIEDGLHAGFCLCHGNMGNLLILKRYAEIFDDKQVRSICDSRFEQILEFLNEENILPTELYNPGFMTGLSGIAYALLKYKMPKLPLLIGVEGIYDRNEV